MAEEDPQPASPEPGGEIDGSDATEADPDGPQRDETTTERADRNWNELLQELRVTQTGLQILTGFLLTLPFQQRFTDLGPTLRIVFLVALALVVTSTVLVVAPVAWHRLLFRRHAKMELVSAGDRLTKAGLSTLALAIVAVVALVFGFVGGETVGIVAAAIAFLLFLLQWVVVPGRMRSRLGHRPPSARV